MANGQEFKFSVSTHLRFGAGQSNKLVDVLSGQGFRKVAVIVDKGVFDLPQVQESVNIVRKSGISLQTYKNESVEPTYAYLESFKAHFLHNVYDCLVGIGGGSTLDLTKAVAVLLTNKGEAISFRGFPQLENRPLPVIAIPTTAGSGSEATYNAVFTDDKEKRRLGINSIFNFPVAAIIDPQLTLSCPKSVTVSSGFDALVHSLESYVNINFTPISRMYSREAFRLLFNNLVKVLEYPKDIEIRSKLALGAYLAGIALVNSGAGPAGAFSYPLGAHYGVPHGLGGAVFLSSIICTNVEKGYAEYAELYDLIDGVQKNLSKNEKSILFTQQVQQLADTLGVPKNLTHFGLSSKDVDFMIAQYDTLKPTVMLNPIEITKDDISKMMKKLA